MSKLALVAVVSPGLEAESIYAVPLLLIDRSSKAATPLTALTVSVPVSVPPAGLAATAMVIEAPLLVTVLPPASCTLTRTAGAMLAPATVALGCVLNASLVAGPTETLKLVLVAPVRTPLEAASV